MSRDCSSSTSRYKTASAVFGFAACFCFTLGLGFGLAGMATPFLIQKKTTDKTDKHRFQREAIHFIRVHRWEL
jgi:hypothetical protein